MAAKKKPSEQVVAEVAIRRSFRVSLVAIINDPNDRDADDYAVIERHGKLPKYRWDFPARFRGDGLAAARDKFARQCESLYRWGAN